MICLKDYPPEHLMRLRMDETHTCPRYKYMGHIPVRNKLYPIRKSTPTQSIINNTVIYRKTHTYCESCRFAEENQKYIKEKVGGQV